MIKIPHPQELQYVDLSVYCIEKETDRRGFLYILYDEIFPEYIKVGRTSDVQKRLLGYNSDKPYRTARMLYVSGMFEDQNEAEKTILDYLYSVTSPTTLSREWFMKEHLETIKETIEKLERQVNIFEEE